MPLKVKFIGAVGAVTGSCHLLKYERSGSYYMIDCGLYQNVRGSKEMNRARGDGDFGGVSPSRITAIYLTHAHMDHCGLIPRMYRLGFKGQVICTRITANFVKEALKDTVEKVDSFDSNLYTKQDVDDIKFYCPDDDRKFQLGYSYPVEPDLFVAYSRTGHLAGAVSITFSANIDKAKNEKLVICFGGDLGPQISQESELSSLLRPVQYPSYNIDYLVLESTYGGHPARKNLSYNERIEAISFAFEKALSPDKGRNPRLIIPAFTLGRTQDLIVDLAYLITRTDFTKRIGNKAPTIVVDSTLARSYSNSYSTEFNNWWFNERKNESKMRLLNRKHAIFEGVIDVNGLIDSLFSGSGERTIDCYSVLGSKFNLIYGRKDISDGPVIYISSSGMCSSGPVMDRMRDNLKQRNATVMFVGYLPSINDAYTLKSAAASWKSPTEIATALQDGVIFKEKKYLEDFNIFTDDIKCALLDYSGIYSGHADSAGLCDYSLRIDSQNPRFKYKPLTIFLVHGDNAPRANLRHELIAYSQASMSGSCRKLESVIIPSANSGWYDLVSKKFEELPTGEPSWRDSLRLLAEASDLQESISATWFKFKSKDGEPLKQEEYLRKIDVLLDNLDQWRMKFRRLTQKAIESEEGDSEVAEEMYDMQEVYLDTSNSSELGAAANVLGLRGKITRAQVRLARAEISKQYHPDANPAATEAEKRHLTSKMQEVNAAHAVILKAFSQS